jgi:DNA-binding GntR family transcriptional regulator
MREGFKKVASQHDQMVAFYKRAIDLGDIADGEAIPTRAEMRDRWRCADSLIGRARKTLADDGYIRSEQGRASYAIGPVQRRLAAVQPPADAGSAAA